jgi:hypothetical protein
LFIGIFAIAFTDGPAFEAGNFPDFTAPASFAVLACFVEVAGISLNKYRRFFLM